MPVAFNKVVCFQCDQVSTVDLPAQDQRKEVSEVSNGEGGAYEEVEECGAIDVRSVARAAAE
jgi:hypothetical protein